MEGYVYLFGSTDPFKLTQTPYQVPYGVLVPKEADGLLVPMTPSSSHLGFQFLRTEVMRMTLGEVAGQAAALCVKHKIQPREVAVPELQEALLNHGDPIFYYTDVPPSHPHFQAVQHLSVMGATEGFEDYSWQPDRVCTKGELAELLCRGLQVEIKMRYTDMWKVMRWTTDQQHFWPSDTSVYFLMTLFNMGVFGEQELETLDPKEAATESEVTRWGEKLAGDSTKRRAILSEMTGNGELQISRGAVCTIVDRLRTAG
jgi:hypothetical protein